jgi:Cu(I)/Ag(I) efflux system membrane protein CusA/SilA
MTATVRRRTGWNGFTCSAIFGRLSPPAVNQPGIRCDGRAGPIGQLADVTIQPGPHDPQRGHENIDFGCSWNISGRDMGSYMADAQKMISEKLPMSNEDTLAWSGQHEIIQ